MTCYPEARRSSRRSLLKSKVCNTFKPITKEGQCCKLRSEMAVAKKASFLGNSRGHFEEFVDEPILTPDATPAQPPHLALPNYVYRLIALNRL
jgi:hypothetical protein